MKNSIYFYLALFILVAGLTFSAGPSGCERRQAPTASQATSRGRAESGQISSDSEFDKRGNEDRDEPSPIPKADSRGPAVAAETVEPASRAERGDGGDDVDGEVSDQAIASEEESDDELSGLNNPLIRRFLAPHAPIAGRWKGLTMLGFDYSTLTISRDEMDDTKYLLHFERKTDFGSWDARRTGTFENGIMTLDEPVERFGTESVPFSVLFAIRANHRNFLVPSVNARQLKQLEQLKPGFAYQRGFSRERDNSR